MKSSKVLIPISLLLFPVVSYADVVINEIMYDLSGSDSGREWVEVYNNGSSAVDISGWRFLETASANNHGFTVVSGSANISSNGFAIIASDPTKFLLDWPAFSGNLYKASFSSLNNTEGTLFLKDKTLKVADQITYSSSQGGSGDGNSLQKSGSSWIANLPTPGLVNAISRAVKLQPKTAEAKKTPALLVGKKDNQPSQNPTTVKTDKPKDSTVDNTTQTASVITVFEAPSSKGLMSSIFSWPMKFFGFIKHLFVEE